MAWKDYEDLDVTREITADEKMEKIREQYECIETVKAFDEPISKGGRADIFKKKYPR